MADNQMGNAIEKLTLDRPVTYEIRAPGQLGESWLQWNERMIVKVEGEGDRSITTLTGAMDQAALQGLLRRLYSTGLPLISAICVRHGMEDDTAETAKSA